MSPDRFQRASEIFLAARRCHATERDVLVVQQCGGDAELLAEVRRLLASDGPTLVSERAGFESPAIAHALRAAAEQALTDSIAATRDPHLGRRIGGYRVQKRIGEGGMGAVYLAEQDNPRRLVALKIIRPGLVSPSLLRRFEHEAHVLGRLQHPGIAQIFEAGAHDSGDGAQPYFAMEYVDGRPLHEFVAGHELSTRDRLELLARIADAVEHAHQRGIIHRDLKPGNILVMEGAGDDEARRRRDGVNSSVSADTLSLRLVASSSPLQPKILDFGVARAIDSDVQVTTLHTGAGQIIGTVAYMSPEQAAGNPDDIDTRSDVYALGVVGYELLAGKPPHDLSKRTVPDALRTILETDASTLGQVDRNLRGDVETIIARAMEKDRGRRYQSAAEFAADIRRYLRDEPILARPPSTMYQLSKFARRNKAVVTGLAIAFIALTLGVIGTGIGLVRSMEQTRKAQRMNEYLKGMIAFLDPSVTKNNQVTLRDVLDDASRRVDAELGSEPEVAAEILTTIARGYHSLVEFDLASQHGRKAIEIMTRSGGGDSQAVAGVWELVGLVHLRAGQPVEAEQAYRAAMEINRERLGLSHPITLGNIRDLLHALDILNKDSEIDALVQQVRTVAAELPARSDDEQVGLALEAVGDVLAMRHQSDDAQQYYLRAIDVLSSVKDSRYAIEQCIVTFRNLGYICELQQRFEEAEGFNSRGTQLAIDTFGFEHQVTLISAQAWARTLRRVGRLEDAERVTRDMVNARRKMYGDDNIDLGRDLNSLGLIMRERGRNDQAIDLFTQALAVRRKMLAPGDPEIGRTLWGLGTSLVDAERGAEAVVPLREAIDIRIQELGEHHSSLLLMRTALGAALVASGEYEEAEPMLLNGYARLTAQPSEQVQALEWLIKLYDAWNKPEKAAEYRAMRPPPPPATAP